MRRAMQTAALMVAIAAATPAAAQYGYDANCRPLPPPGYVMQPQAPSQECLRQRAQAARAAEAERQRRAAAAEAEVMARQQRIEQERFRCETATADDVRSAIEQDPANLSQFVKILDLTAPHYDGTGCRSEVMTVRGILHTLITFRDFNGKQFILVRVVGRD